MLFCMSSVASWFIKYDFLRFYLLTATDIFFSFISGWLACCRGSAVGVPRKRFDHYGPISVLRSRLRGYVSIYISCAFRVLWMRYHWVNRKSRWVDDGDQRVQRLSGNTWRWLIIMFQRLAVANDKLCDFQSDMNCCWNFNCLRLKNESSRFLGNDMQTMNNNNNNCMIKP